MNNILFFLILSLFINSIFSYNIDFIRLFCQENKYIKFNSIFLTKTFLNKTKIHYNNNRKNRTKINNFKLINYNR